MFSVLFVFDPSGPTYIVAHFTGKKEEFGRYFPQQYFPEFLILDLRATSLKTVITKPAF